MARIIIAGRTIHSIAKPSIIVDTVPNKFDIPTASDAAGSRMNEKKPESEAVSVKLFLCSSKLDKSVLVSLRISRNSTSDCDKISRFGVHSLLEALKTFKIGVKVGMKISED